MEEQSQTKDASEIDQLIKEAQLKKLQKEIAKIEQETNELKRSWFNKGLTFETFAKVILGLGSVFFVLSAIVAPYYAYREQKLIAARDSIGVAKSIADKLYNDKLAQVRQLADSINILRNNVRLLRGSALTAKKNYLAVSEKLTNIKRDSIRKSDKRVQLNSTVSMYKNCLFKAFEDYINYVRSSEGQRLAAGELGINVKMKKIKNKVTLCSNDFRSSIKNIGGSKNDLDLNKEIDLAESTVEKHFQDVFRTSSGLFPTEGGDIDMKNFNMATDETFEEIERMIKVRLYIK